MDFESSGERLQFLKNSDLETKQKIQEKSLNFWVSESTLKL